MYEEYVAAVSEECLLVDPEAGLCWKDYISLLDWECLRLPEEGL